MEVVQGSGPALTLQQAYLETGVVTSNRTDDVLLIALACVSESSVIIIWNFKHIINLRRILLYNTISVIHGYRSIEFRPPMEILGYDDEDH